MTSSLQIEIYCILIHTSKETLTVPSVDNKIFCTLKEMLAAPSIDNNIFIYIEVRRKRWFFICRMDAASSRTILLLGIPSKPALSMGLTSRPSHHPSVSSEPSVLHLPTENPSFKPTEVSTQPSISTRPRPPSHNPTKYF
eukprot:scaffold27542_cov33-Attheya_sp.AAC.2